MRRALPEPLWLVLLVVLLAGAVAGSLAARADVSDTTASVLGHAWRGDPDDARAVLLSLFGLEITVLTIVLSLNSPAIQAAANQYSPRLVPFYLRNAPLRQAIPVFVLSGAYMVAATRELGLSAYEGVRPRPVISGAFLLLFAAFSLLVVELVRTFRFMRVERVLALVRRSTFAAARRWCACVERLEVDCDALAPVVLPSRRAELLSAKAGYLVEIDLHGLTALARSAGARVRTCRAVGEFVDTGEVIGWAVSENGEPVDAALARRLAGTLTLAATREPDYDPVYGVRILADVAARALSTSTNDAYTARQALQQIRSVLRYVARLPLGNWNVVDPDGTARVSVRAITLRELISVAVDGPLRAGGGDPEVLEGVLEIALEVGLIADRPKDRAVMRRLVARVLEDATDYGRLDASRLSCVRAQAELVRTSLDRNARCTERLALSDWALRDDEPS